MQQLLGLVLLIAIIAFVVFAFRQGQKVKRPPRGVPPDITPPPSF